MRNFLFYFMLFFIFFGCKDDKSKQSLNDNLKIVSNSKLLKGWKTYSNDSIKVNIPSYWKPRNIDDALLFIPIDKKLNLYYAVVTFNSSKINATTYIKEVFKAVIKKSPKLKYVLREVNLKNTKKFYTIELYLDQNNIKYKFYVLIYDSGSQIYDFSYITLDDNKNNAKNYQTFYSVLFSFEHKYDNIIDGDKFMIENDKILRYENL